MNTRKRNCNIKFHQLLISTWMLLTVILIMFNTAQTSAQSNLLDDSTISIPEKSDTTRKLFGGTITNSGYGGVVLKFSSFNDQFAFMTQTSGTFADNRDGQTYEFVVIGNQTWMAENLNYITPESWCYADSISNCEIYGRLYTWRAAMTACPENWHLPSDDEWKILELFIGMTKEEADIFLYRGEGKGTKLKSKSYFGSSNNQDSEYNQTGFNALLSGFRMYTDGAFVGKTKDARWWTSSTEVWEGNTYAFRRCIYFDKTGIDRDAATRSLGFSVRCVKTQPRNP